MDSRYVQSEEVGADVHTLDMQLFYYVMLDYTESVGKMVSYNKKKTPVEFTSSNHRHISNFSHFIFRVVSQE